MGWVRRRVYTHAGLTLVLPWLVNRRRPFRQPTSATVLVKALESLRALIRALFKGRRELG